VTAGESRAQSSTFSGVIPTPVQRDNISFPSGTHDDKVVERILITPPTSWAESDIAAYEFEPVRIGFLMDSVTGAALADIIDPYILAIEDAMNEGRFTRPVELVTILAIGYPNGTAKRVLDGFDSLVDEGCLAIFSPFITDNGLVLRDRIEECGVPAIGMIGTARFNGEYCFIVANGAHGDEAALLANFVRRRGHRRVAFIGERSPGDREYQDFFRDEARFNGLEIVAEHFFDQRPGDEIKEALIDLRDSVKPDALVYCGFGWTSHRYNSVLEEIGWDPPKYMNTAIMWAVQSPEWALALEGWIGIEQCTDFRAETANPNVLPLFDRFEVRFGRRVEHFMIALAYDQARVVMEGLTRAPVLTPAGVKEGLERIRMMPCALGGPRTYIGFGRQDHRAYKGDYLMMKRIRNGAFEFVDLHRPEFKSNWTTQSPEGK
jgi:branched-chain amino acid transport system substrate-binding protein